MQRPAAPIALTLPVLAGLGWMAAQGAPSHMLAINAASLVAGLALLLLLPLPKLDAKVGAAILLAFLFLPLVIGPELNGVRRWIGGGSFWLNSGLLVLPALAVLATRLEERWQLGIGLAALAAAVVQPDAALALAVGIAAVGVALANRDTRPALVAIAALLAAIWAQKNGVLAPVRFVERVYVDAAIDGIGWFILLLAAGVASIVLVSFDRAMRRVERFALAGAMAGFAYTAAIGNYPTPLTGYGAAAILGLALALWLARADNAHTPSG